MWIVYAKFYGILYTTWTVRPVYAGILVLYIIS